MSAVCSVELSLNEAARIMWDFDCGFAPVVDRGHRVVGVLTDRDIAMAAYTRGLPIREISVSEVMARTVYAVQPQDTVEAAEVLMRSVQVRRLPVVDMKNCLLGIVTLSDLFQVLVPPGEAPRGDVVGRLARCFARITEPREGIEFEARSDAPRERVSALCVAPH